jgi:hypothetical protein
MSESTDTQRKITTTRASDERAIAQVERWMALIREISREKRGKD